jgi:hypothetical protein
VASAGTGGVDPGFTIPWACIVTTGLSIMGFESTAEPIGHISLWAKLAGKRSAGNLHAAFDEAGTGNVAGANAPVLDPTREGAHSGLPRK